MGELNVVGYFMDRSALSLLSWTHLLLHFLPPRVCLVHFAKFCKDVKMAFEVLNEVYLQNFLHRWVVNRETNLMMLINPCLINN